jgi:hypothetical protein
LIHFYKRDESEKSLLLTRRAPDTSAVRSPSIEERVPSNVSKETSQKRKGVFSTYRAGPPPPQRRATTSKIQSDQPG